MARDPLRWLSPCASSVPRIVAGVPGRGSVRAACELGFYKSAPGDQLCARCPPHSHSAAPAAQACRCDLSYYRAALDPPSAACTRPPSAPVNLISSVNGTSVTLEWAPPLDPGGRSDITYNAVCRRCPWALSHCEACGSGTRFVPQQTSLVQASLLVANLLAHMNYSFWIEAVNGVSDLSPEPRRAAIVNITTNQAGRWRRSSQLLAHPCPPRGGGQSPAQTRCGLWATGRLSWACPLY
ncbi:Hypothetical predicted protein [Marmota monax]|uniref:Fibronectin type-III domain-containing protein n=1 Tax=Marmota monax TaxID=9995 RepID=A0A5E4A0Q7_MARMO|nr:hypothetical protein GHT09_001174 [Marmota monax]VTJ50798.1 Hypothetical predicted protein [Marmota monax]